MEIIIVTQVTAQSKYAFATTYKDSLRKSILPPAKDNIEMNVILVLCHDGSLCQASKLV